MSKSVQCSELVAGSRNQLIVPLNALLPVFNVVENEKVTLCLSVRPLAATYIAMDQLISVV